jgi:Zn-dependent peptidase ImmA (M78 family)
MNESKFTKYHRYTAKEFLEALALEHSFPIEPPIDVEKIVHLLDVKLDETADFDNLTTAGSVSLNSDHAKIWVNPIENDFEPRKRFTIAHEIAHLILHIDPENGVKEFIDTKKTLNRKDSYWDSKEYEANNFAAQLLMPVFLLKRHGKEIIDDYKKLNNGTNMPLRLFLKEMALLFNVSEPAMKYRLKNIGAIKT